MVIIAASHAAYQGSSPWFGRQLTSWPSGPRRCVKAAVFIGVGSNPTEVIFCYCCRYNDYRAPVYTQYRYENWQGIKIGLNFTSKSVPWDSLVFEPQPVPGWSLRQVGIYHNRYSLYALFIGTLSFAPFGYDREGAEPNPIIWRLFNSHCRGVTPIENCWEWETLRTSKNHWESFRTAGNRLFLEQRESSFVDPVVLERSVNVRKSSQWALQTSATVPNHVQSFPIIPNYSELFQIVPNHPQSPPIIPNHS